MTHLDDGRLHALMDEELDNPDASAVRLHLEDCDACKHRMAELEERSALVARALDQLDTATPPSGARDAVLARVGSGSSSPAETRSRVFRMSLARAAILVLFLGGGLATALPASPVRGWIAAGWGRVTDLFDSQNDSGTQSPAGGATTQDGSDDAPSGTSAGVRLDAAGQDITIVLRGIDSGTLIVVRFVPGGEAGAFADDPATFRTSEGRIEVIGASNRVVVDLPEDAASASIEVNGGIYLRKEGDRIDPTGPIEPTLTEEIHLRVP